MRLIRHYLLFKHKYPRQKIYYKAKLRNLIFEYRVFRTKLKTILKIHQTIITL